MLIMITHINNPTVAIHPQMTRAFSSQSLIVILFSVFPVPHLTFLCIVGRYNQCGDEYAHPGSHDEADAEDDKLCHFINSFICFAFLCSRITTMTKMTNVMERLIHNGLNTHHHDQLITLVSFKTINTSVSNDPKLIPLLDDLFSLILLFFPHNCNNHQVAFPIPSERNR